MPSYQKITSAKELTEDPTEHYVEILVGLRIEFGKSCNF